MKTGFIFLFLLVSASLYAQGHNTRQDCDTIPIELGTDVLHNLLIHTSNIWQFSFQFLDGTAVTTTKLSTLLNIPQNNQVLVKQIWRGQITNNIVQSIMWASLGGLLVYTAVDLPGTEIATPVFGGTWLISFLASTFIQSTRNMRILQAVDNFNLYLLGIPVTGLRN